METKMRYREWDCVAEFGTYANGGKAIQLYDAETGEPIATATVWVPGLAENEVAVKDYSENGGMLQALIESGIVGPPVRHEQSGFVRLPICQLQKKA